MEGGTTPDQPHHATLRVEGRIFGSTLARVAVAMHALPAGRLLAVHTNDP